MNDILRRTYGLKHFDVTPSSGFLYQYDDLIGDMRLFGSPISISGHGLRPYTDFKEMNNRMNWYTTVRDPIARCISHYQHQVEKMGSQYSLKEWIEKPHHKNWMLWFYGGSNSVDQAKRAILDKQMQVVFLSEGLYEGMEFLFGKGITRVYGEKNKPKTGDTARKIRQNPKLMSIIEEANRGDYELLEFLRTLEIKPFKPVTSCSRVRSSINSGLSYLHRNCVYKPLKRVILVRRRTSKNTM
ncbi:MAG: hypothetical protein KAR44_05795 [Candidatus Aegiribacteria sp.]|nr:hypothetical protein [Candidatus Aegiribacteria sp.]